MPPKVSVFPGFAACFQELRGLVGPGCPQIIQGRVIIPGFPKCTIQPGGLMGLGCPVGVSRLVFPGFPGCVLGLGGILGSGCPHQQLNSILIIPGYPNCIIGHGGLLGRNCPQIPGGRLSFFGFTGCVIHAGGLMGSKCPQFIGGRIVIPGFPYCVIALGGHLGAGCPAIPGHRIFIPGFPHCVIGFGGILSPACPQPPAISSRTTITVRPVNLPPILPAATSSCTVHQGRLSSGCSVITIPGFPNCVIGHGGALGSHCPPVPGGQITFQGFPNCYIHAGGIIETRNCPHFTGGHLVFSGYPQCIINYGGQLGSECPAIPGGKVGFGGFPSCVVGNGGALLGIACPHTSVVNPIQGNPICFIQANGVPAAGCPFRTCFSPQGGGAVNCPVPPYPPGCVVSLHGFLNQYCLRSQTAIAATHRQTLAVKQPLVLRQSSTTEATPPDDASEVPEVIPIKRNVPTQPPPPSTPGVPIDGQISFENS